VIFADFERGLKREKLGTAKEGTLRLRVFVVRFPWVGKHRKHLG